MHSFATEIHPLQPASCLWPSTLSIPQSSSSPPPPQFTRTTEAPQNCCCLLCSLWGSDLAVQDSGLPFMYWKGPYRTWTQQYIDFPFLFVSWEGIQTLTLSRSSLWQIFPSEVIPIATTFTVDDVLASIWSLTACPICFVIPTLKALVKIHAPEMNIYNCEVFDNAAGLLWSEKR